MRRFLLTMLMLAALLTASGSPSQAELIAHWNFNESSGTLAADSSGSDLNGTLVNNPTWIVGRFGNALNFNSVNQQRIEIGSNNVVTNLSGEKTFAFWTRLRTNPIADPASVFIGIDNGTSGSRWFIDDNNGGSTNAIRIGGSVVTSSLGVGNGTLKYNKDVWQHVVIADDGSGSGGTRVYVDRQLVGTTSSFDYSGLPEECVLRLGMGQHGSGSRYLYGDLDDFGIWNVALTVAQVAGLYQFAEAPTLGYDLGQMQQLYDLHGLGPGGGELLLDNVWRWQYTDGLNTGLGLLTMQDGRYFFRLDAAGTGLMAIVPEPSSGMLLLWSLAGAFLMRGRRAGKPAGVSR